MKIIQHIFGASGEISPAAGFIAQAPEYVLAHTFEPEAVAYADRVNDDSRAPRAIDRFVELAAARVIDTVCQQNDRAPSHLLVRRNTMNLVSSKHFIGGNV